MHHQQGEGVDIKCLAVVSLDFKNFVISCISFCRPHVKRSKTLTIWYCGLDPCQIINTSIQRGMEWFSGVSLLAVERS